MSKRCWSKPPGACTGPPTRASPPCEAGTRRSNADAANRSRSSRWPDDSLAFSYAMWRDGTDYQPAKIRTHQTPPSSGRNAAGDCVGLDRRGRQAGGARAQMYLAASESRAEESAAPPSNHLVRRHPEVPRIERV